VPAATSVTGGAAVLSLQVLVLVLVMVLLVGALGLKPLIDP
jgi:hypothetical protein